MSQAFCISCGNHLENRKFCIHCGVDASVSHIVLSPEPAPTVVAPVKVKQPKSPPPKKILTCVRCGSEILTGLTCITCSSAPNYSSPASYKANSLSGEYWLLSLASVVAILVYVSFIGSTYVYMIFGRVLAIVMVIGLLTGLIFGKRIGIFSFSIATSIAFVALFITRFGFEPRLGVTIGSEEQVLIFSDIDPTGSLGKSGWGTPLVVEKIDGQYVGSYADLRKSLSRKRVFDSIQITGFDGRLSQTYQAMIGW
jgi:hypothetical protein